MELLLAPLVRLVPTVRGSSFLQGAIVSLPHRGKGAFVFPLSLLALTATEVDDDLELALFVSQVQALHFKPRLDIAKLHPKAAPHACRLPKKAMSNGTASACELQWLAGASLRALIGRRGVRGFSHSRLRPGG